MKDLFFEKKMSLSNEICDKLIDYFNNRISNNMVNECCGLFTYSDCYCHYITTNCTYVTLQTTSELYKELNRELLICLNEYKTKLDYDLNLIMNKLVINEYNILKYDMDSGYSTKHFDILNNTPKYCRLFNFIWFLNDCEFGGEIEFFEKYKIIPEKGKFLIFPTEWFIVFSHKIPKSCHKYIIQGWIYMIHD
jgi:hypothetical protein